MRYREVVLAVLAPLSLLLWPGHARAQADSAAKVSESEKTISVTASRPVAKAMDIIEKRYGTPVDYTEPIYTSTMDTQLLYTLHGRRLTSPLLIPRIRTISVKYEEVKEAPRGIPYLSCREPSATCNPVFVWPKLGVTALIKKVLRDLAAHGGPILAVRKVTMRYGPRWEVYPLRVRNSLGTFVPQPDFLSATVRIPASTTIPYGLPKVVAEQLTQKWGHKFEWGGCCLFIEGVPPPETKLGHSLTLSARQALLYHVGWRREVIVLCGLSDPGCNINIVQRPYREPPRPPTPPAVPARMVPAHPHYPSHWLFYSRSPKIVRQIQGALARAGYLHAAPTTKWDANAVTALRRFQAANGLRPSGKFDIWTVRKLQPYLPKIPARIEPAKPAMDPALAYWLESTPDGRKEIEEALKKAGYYNGATTTTARNPGAEAALKAFQKGNGLHPTGYFDYATAEKLAPFLPKPKE